MSCSFFTIASVVFAAQRNALAPQLPSHRSRSVTSIQNITILNFKFSGVETEVELILERMRVFKRRRIYWKGLSVKLIVKVKR